MKTWDLARIQRARFWLLFGGLLLVAPLLSAQRHGRPDSAQNYVKDIPEPVLKIVVAGQGTNVHRQDLAMMNRTSREGPRSKSGSARSYAGTLLSQLLTPSDVGNVDTYEIHYGFFHRRRLRRSDLEPGADLLIADTRCLGTC
jgi:hypothetical protein